jgi:hypothetical protein
MHSHSCTRIVGRALHALHAAGLTRQMPAVKRRNPDQSAASFGGLFLRGAGSAGRRGGCGRALLFTYTLSRTAIPAKMHAIPGPRSVPRKVTRQSEVREICAAEVLCNEER